MPHPGGRHQGSTPQFPCTCVYIYMYMYVYITCAQVCSGSVIELISEQSLTNDDAGHMIIYSSIPLDRTRSSI